MVELNKEQVIVVAVTGVLSLAGGLVAGRFWGKSAARKEIALADAKAKAAETDKPADTTQAA